MQPEKITFLSIFSLTFTTTFEVERANIFTHADSEHKVAKCSSIIVPGRHELTYFQDKFIQRKESGPVRHADQGTE